MSTLRLLSLCTGIGVIDYVWSTLLGQEIAGQVEINPYCQALLQERWPDVPKACDIKELREDDPFGAVDIVAGGIPCQPFSAAGKRRGTEDDRHLWPYAFAIVRRKRPTFVLIENVARFVGMALDVVSSDLESAGYQSRAYVLPACAIGAPHTRERVFIVAHTTSSGVEVRQTANRLSIQSRASDTCMAHTGSNRWGDRPDQPQCVTGGNATPNACDDGTQGTMAYTHSQRCQECNASPSHAAAGQCARCVSTHRAHGQPQPGMGGVLDGLAHWMDCAAWPALPGEAQHTWEPVRTITRRVPHRAARLEALGNAIVPQQIYPFLAFMVAHR